LFILDFLGDGALMDSTLMRLRAHVRRSGGSSVEPVACWRGEELLDGVVVPSFTIILRTVGCRFAREGGCTMCGYITDAAAIPPTKEELIAQFDSALAKAPDSRFMVKIFTSGSFFDPCELPVEVQDYILRRLQQDERVVKLVVESRPEFVQWESFQRARSLFFKPFEVAIGLETADDTIRSFCINKNFSFDDFRKACAVAAGEDVRVKVYLLLKPPFLSEGDAIRDVVDSVSKVAEYAQTVSINVCNIQRGTLVEALYLRGGYRPPWLWSVVEVLRRAKEVNSGLVVISDPVAAGMRRGPCNCGECSGVVAGLIRDFSITQKVEVLESFSCDCRCLWERVVELEDYTYGAQL
jgi:hypothetical protein